MVVTIHKTDNNEIPGFRGQNDEDREQNEDTVVTSLRWERQMYGELTDKLSGNTDEVTHSLSGDVSGNIRDTHMDTCEGSQPRYRDVCLPEPFLDGHRINFGKTESVKNTSEKQKKIDHTEDRVENRVNGYP